MGAQPDNLIASVAGAALFLPVDDRIFAICFGRPTRYGLCGVGVHWSRHNRLCRGAWETCANACDQDPIRASTLLPRLKDLLP